MGVVGLCGVHRADATAGNDVLDGLSGRQGSTVSGPGGRRSTDRVRCVKEADTETRQRHRSAGRSPNAACVVPGRATARADDLLVLIAHGSMKALAELYDLVAPLLLALLRSRHSTVDQAKDALVDVFAQIWRTAAAYSTGPFALDWIIDQTQGDARTGAPRRPA